MSTIHKRQLTFRDESYGDGFVSASSIGQEEAQMIGVASIYDLYDEVMIQGWKLAGKGGG